VDRLWLVRDGTVKPYEGDLGDYRQLVTGGASDRRDRREADKSSKADRRREAAQRRAALEPLAREIKASEALIERLRGRLEAIETRLADPSLYEREPAKVTELTRERGDQTGKLAAQEDRWLALSTEYEEAMAA
jgi:ATP-binding cassette subfamily F protein 3